MGVDIKYLVACEHSSIDTLNRLSAVAIFDRIKLGGKSEISLSTSLAGKIILSDSEDLGDINVVIKIVDPDGKTQNDVKFPLSGINKKETILIIAAKFPHVEFKKAGSYDVQIFVDEKKIGGQEDIFRVEK